MFDFGIDLIAPAHCRRIGARGKSKARSKKILP
jgi:hypothetical protein